MYNIIKTQQEIIKDEIREINITANAGILNLKQAVNSGYQQFWFNSLVTPQEICDILGNQAFKLFEDHRDASLFLLSKDSEYVVQGVPENFTADINNDGTVTITYTEPILPIEEDIV